MEDVLVPLLIFGAPARRREEFTERLLSAAVPGSVGQRLAFAAVVANQQISSREQAELRTVKEAAARFTDAEDLADHAPTISGIYVALPDAVKATVQFNTDSTTQERQRAQGWEREEQEEIREAQAEIAEVLEKGTRGRKA